MPIHIGTDTTGKFFQWGKTGKKYYFDPDNESSRKRALGKAKKQQTAIYSAGWKGDEMKILKVTKKIKKADAHKTIDKDFGDIRVSIWLQEDGSLFIRQDGYPWVSFFCSSVAGGADNIKEALVNLAWAKSRVKNYDAAIKWAVTEVKRLSK